MSERGVFGVDRGIWDHGMFAGDEPFTRREAWLWMISECAWKATRVRVNHKTLSVERGQFVHSLRFMASKFKWSVNKVRRFILELETDAMVNTHTDNGMTHVTVCKYDDYQVVGLPKKNSDEYANEQTGGTGTEQGRHREEEIKTLRTDRDRARATGGSFSTEGSTKLASVFLNALGFSTPLSVPPEFAGVPWRAVDWERRGYSEAMIAAEAARIGPGKPLSYHEKVFKTAHEQGQQPARTGYGKPATGSGNIIPAIERLSATIAGFDAGPSEIDQLRGGQGTADVRLLSQG